MRDFTLKELVDVAYPSATNKLPVSEGYDYSNTNYILAGMIAEKATGKSYRDLVHELVIEPHGLYSTFYEASIYPESVIKRLSHGYFENEACTDYQPPDCKESWNAPIIGRDTREDTLSWAQSAGGAIASARDVDRWMRAIFGGKVVPPKQQKEWTQLVSTKTGEPIATVTPDDPAGFALGLAYRILGPLGAQWFYQGETLGYRTLYVWIADEDLMITVQTNSQPPEGTDKISDAVAPFTRSSRSRKPIRSEAGERAAFSLPLPPVSISSPLARSSFSDIRQYGLRSDLALRVTILKPSSLSATACFSSRFLSIEESRCK